MRNIETRRLKLNPLQLLTVCLKAYPDTSRGFFRNSWEGVPFRENVASFARAPDGGVRGYEGIATSHAPQIVFLIAVMFCHRIQRETRKSRSA
jgi:hypothetical protein